MSFTLPTRGSVVSDFLDRYPEAGNTLAEHYYGIAFNWACDLVSPQYLTNTLNLTAGTREYTLPNDVVGATFAEYVYSATWATKLFPVTIGELDATRMNWRSFSGIPIDYYVYAKSGSPAVNVMGFSMNPTVSTTGGYPFVRYAAQMVDDTVDGDTLPASFRDGQAVLARMFYLHCVKFHPNDLATFKAVVDMFADELSARLAGIHSEAEPTIISGPRFARLGRF